MNIKKTGGSTLRKELEAQRKIFHSDNKYRGFILSRSRSQQHDCGVKN